VWGTRYIDEVILRDENKDGDADCVDGADQRLYVTQDANWNVTAIVNTAGTVVERVLYDAYGKSTLYNAAWSATQASTLYNNEVLYSGYRLDPESGLYQVRNRHYHPTLGRWVRRDPVGYAGGTNLYEYSRGRAAIMTDPMGLLPLNGWDYAELIDPAPPPQSGRPDCTNARLVSKVRADIWSPGKGDKCVNTKVEILIQVDTCDNEINENGYFNPANGFTSVTPPSATPSFNANDDTFKIVMEIPVTCSKNGCCDFNTEGDIELKVEGFTALKVHYRAFNDGENQDCTIDQNAGAAIDVTHYGRPNSYKSSSKPWQWDTPPQ